LRFVEPLDPVIEVVSHDTPLQTRARASAKKAIHA